MGRGLLPGQPQRGPELSLQAGKGGAGTLEEGQRKKHKIPFFSSLQVKYALSYLVIFAVVLVLLNTYPVIASQDLLFRSKRDSLKSQAAVMASALMELETLTSDQVVRVMNMLDNSGLTRILVTDPAGFILYDSLTDSGTQDQEEQEEPEQQEPVYRYALYQEIVLALRGKDVFCSQFVNNTFVSTVAWPIVYRGMTIGAIYILEQDEAQGALLVGLQQNLRYISLVIAATTLVLSAFFSKMLTARIAALLRAIRIVGEGEYGHRLQPVGRDEMAQLAEEFNQLTDRLQTTEEVRRRFVSDASHELKTPLASIRLLTDSILQNDHMDQETVRDFVSDIGDEAERLTRITEHLLALTRLDSLPAKKTVPVDVSKVAQRAAGRLGPVADAAGVTIESSLKPGCVILCTEDELYQICFNLLENAVKYNFVGGHVYLSVYPERDQVLLEVEDTGIGIPEEDLPKVFNRFYRVDKARSRAAGGTGLGLSIVRDTVRRHGGWVTARPRNPEGSVFTVGFPLYVPETEEEAT
ncbi:sensor histidine kinase [Pseudoflavonifractor sp. AF19-9AC]|nr:sensor histidine kinase [Pseudoflavonifractor sp. AF19-9AC]